MKLINTLAIIACLLSFSGCTKYYTLAKSTKVDEKVIPNGFPEGASFAIIQIGEPSCDEKEMVPSQSKIENKIKQSLEQQGCSVTSPENADYFFGYQFIKIKGVYKFSPAAPGHYSDRAYTRDSLSHMFYVTVLQHNSLKEAWRGISCTTSLKKDLDEEAFNELIDAVFNSFGRNDKIMLDSNMQVMNDEIERVMSEKSDSPS